MDRGTFTISLDFELIWGTMDKAGVEKFAPACRAERDVVVDRLLDLFSRYGISATWCILGHLFLDNCDAEHLQIARPKHEWVSGDWFQNDPGTSEKRDPIFYGRELVEKIRRAPVPQEIGSHSFSHIIFGDPGCSVEAADTDLRECVNVASKEGIALRSFAYPRNRVGHRDALKRHGFVSYRGPEPSNYTSWPRPFARAMHFVEVIAASTPPVVTAQRDDLGLWDIPGSMIYFPMHGIRAAIPVSRRVKRAIRGLDAAAAQKKIFHLWFHPTNLADHTDALFEGLEEILRHAKQLEERGLLEIATMGEIAEQANIAPRPAKRGEGGRRPGEGLRK
jgi:peptidoglycan/xylan/chitin deacetylase (PgdA/CDA1 family)